MSEKLMDRIIGGELRIVDLYKVLPSNYKYVNEFDFDPEIFGLTWEEFEFIRRFRPVTYGSSILRMILAAREIKAVVHGINNVYCLGCHEVRDSFLLRAPQHAVVAALAKCPSCTSSRAWEFPAYYFDINGNNLGMVSKTMGFVANVNYYE